MVKTKDAADLAFLDELLPKHPGVYAKHVVKPVNKDYREMYGSVQDDRLYVKMDDDIVFIQAGLPARPAPCQHHIDPCFASICPPDRPCLQTKPPSMSSIPGRPSMCLPQDGAIEELLEEHLARRYLFVSANVVNHPILTAVHNRMGATLPFHPPARMWRDNGRDWELHAQPDALDSTFMGRAQYATPASAAVPGCRCMLQWHCIHAPMPWACFGTVP